MTADQQRKKRYILPGVILIVLLVVIVSFGSALSAKDIPAFQTKPSVDVVNKVRQAQKQGGLLELDDAEANSIIHLYTQKKLQSEPLLEELNCRLGENRIELFAKGTMKGKVDFWLYSQGTVEYRQGDIVYKPLVFKLGKVPLPKAFVMRKLQEFSYDGVEVAEDEIVMKKELFPLEITSLTIAENKLSVELKKITVDIPIDSSDAESSISAKPVVQPTEEKAGNSNPENSRSQEEEEPSEPAPTETEEAKVLLQSVYSDLSVVYSSVKTSKEKQIIGAMMGTVSNLIEDPASSYKSEAAWVVAEYKKLSEEEKNDLKQAMLTNMDIRTAIEVKSLFGL